MKVLVSGSTGFVGTALVAALRTSGHTPMRLLRPSSGPDGPTFTEPKVEWDPANGWIDRDALEGIDAVVHLAGEGIASTRWTDDHKERVLTSRVDGTTLLAEALAGLDRPPSVLLSGSAVGFYGDRGDEILTEDSEPGRDFLAGVVEAWEASTVAAREAGIRVACLRSGIVLSPGGGALAPQLPFFRLGLGGRIGSGDQWMSWISLADEVAAIIWLLDHDVDGPVNLTAPAPVTNAEFTDALGTALGRPTVLPIPKPALWSRLGREGTDAMLYVSQRVVPDVLTKAGFSFTHPTIERAFADLFAGDEQQAVSVSRDIPEPADRIFDLLASPAGHARIDGSGMVRDAISGPDRLALGARFHMEMKAGPLPYKIHSEVVEFEENRRIAWAHLGKHRWRYELQPIDGGTRVTETFDWSTARIGWIIEVAGYPDKHPANMAATLARIERVLAED